MTENYDQKIISSLTKIILKNKIVRNISSKVIEKRIYKAIVEKGNPSLSKKSRLDIFYASRALYVSILRNLNKGLISKKEAEKVANTLLKEVIFKASSRKKAIALFEEKYGVKPPMFVTISPTKRCNLNCTGCYASSTALSGETLEWGILEKIMNELHDSMGMRFFVISGGEPLAYRSEGKTILDLPRKWKDSFFLMYTNGTLINESIAKEMAELGNITPAISVEGFGKETDERRGSGIYKKILNSTSLLKKNGILFGISVTATSKNINLLLTEKFYDFYFQKVGASYMWMFQYMPIGRKFTTELMISPEQRFSLFKKWRYLIGKKQYFIADFWNSSILSNGCISCGRAGGYFYIDWNGNIMPCVFVPYYKDNVKKLFAKKKTITDALFSDFFIEGRKWQLEKSNPYNNKGNALTPCFIRDHHNDFVKIAKKCKVSPEDNSAREAMIDKGYHKEMIKFDKRLKEIEDPYWDQEYKIKKA